MKVNNALIQTSMQTKLANGRYLKNQINKNILNLLKKQYGVGEAAVQAAAAGAMSQPAASRVVVSATNSIKNIINKGISPENYLKAGKNYTKNRKNFFGRVPEALTRPGYKNWWRKVNAYTQGGGNNLYIPTGNKNGNRVIYEKITRNGPGGLYFTNATGARYVESTSGTGYVALPKRGNGGGNGGAAPNRFKEMTMQNLINARAQYNQMTAENKAAFNAARRAKAERLNKTSNNYKALMG